jgi:hypothetical protein
MKSAYNIFLHLIGVPLVASHRQVRKSLRLLILTCFQGAYDNHLRYRFC